MGNLTRDPELKYTPKGMAICNFGMALNRVWKNEAGEKQEEVTFIDVDAFGRKAEIAGEYLKKGHLTFIACHVKLDSWDDKASGQKRTKIKFVVDELVLLPNGRQEGSSERSERPSGRPATPPKRPPVDPDLDAPEDDIPF